jgi:prepilin-type N-terminal cleavage/methylation domain-containing protein
MKRIRGFTLIELLIVVAIIGLLSSVVLSSMRDARLKAADAAVLQQARELRNLMEQERSNSGTYVAIKSGGAWKPQSGCTGFTGQFATQATQVCQSLVKATSGYCSTSCVFFQSTNPNSSERYTIMAYLPYQSTRAGAARYMCFGSSGNSTTTATGAPWLSNGCYANP